MPKRDGILTGRILIDGQPISLLTLARRLARGVVLRETDQAGQPTGSAPLLAMTSSEARDLALVPSYLRQSELHVAAIELPDVPRVDGRNENTFVRSILRKSYALTVRDLSHLLKTQRSLHHRKNPKSKKKDWNALFTLEKAMESVRGSEISIAHALRIAGEEAPKVEAYRVAAAKPHSHQFLAETMAKHSDIDAAISIVEKRIRDLVHLLEIFGKAMSAEWIVTQGKRDLVTAVKHNYRREKGELELNMFGTAGLQELNRLPFIEKHWLAMFGFVNPSDIYLDSQECDEIADMGRYFDAVIVAGLLRDGHTVAFCFETAAVICEIISLFRNLPVDLPDQFRCSVLEVVTALELSVGVANLEEQMSQFVEGAEFIKVIPTFPADQQPDGTPPSSATQ